MKKTFQNDLVLFSNVGHKKNKNNDFFEPNNKLNKNNSENYFNYDFYDKNAKNSIFFDNNLKNNQNNLINQEKTQENNQLNENLIILNDKHNELEKRIKNIESSSGTNIDLSDIESDIQTNASNITSLQSSVSTNTSNITSLQSSVSTNTSNITSLQSSVSTNTSNISNLQNTVGGFSSSINTLQTQNATNLSNISNLTTSVNSCIQAINEINNGAELPAPLFSISGVSFGTPVYSVYDEYINQNFFNFVDSTNLTPIFFLAEPFVKVNIKIELSLQVPTLNTKRNIVVRINNTEIKKIEVSDTTEGIKNFTVDLSFIPSSRSNKIFLFCDYYQILHYHLFSKISLFGKNVLFLNSKRSIQIAPSIDNKYLFTRSFNGFPQYQEAIFNNLDFENGWQYIPNYQNFKGIFHYYCKTYNYDSTNNTYTYLKDYLLFSSQNGQYVKLCYDISNSIISNTLKKGLCSASTYIRDNQGKELDLFFSLASAGNETSYMLYKLANNSTTQMLTQLGYSINNLTRPEYIVDSVIPISISNAFKETHASVVIMVSNEGNVYSYIYSRNNGGGGTCTLLGFGTQPYAYFDQNDANILHINLNVFGTIVCKTYSISNRDLIFISETIVDYGDYLITGKNNNRFLQFNNNIIKK